MGRFSFSILFLGGFFGVQKNEPNSSYSAVPVAIVGIGCRLPQARGPRMLWQLLRDGVDAVSAAPPERSPEARNALSAPGTPGGRGGFLDGIEEFDAAFFSISPREAIWMDPQQRLLLETAWEAFEDAGLTQDQLRGSDTGVFVGLQSGEYWELLHRAEESGGPERDLHAGLGSGLRSVMSGRISYAFDLRGPSATVDAACSSSLVAVHQAVQSIRSGESGMAVAGGANLLIRPILSTIMAGAGALAPDGRCKFGDADADGFVRADGVGVVVLKPLDRALADGDDVYAVIRGTASGNDGQASGYLMAPAVEGQLRTMLAAYADAGIDPATVDYVEAHGTGTSVGDPVELEALGTVLSPGRDPDRPCLVGSVKTNIGHTEATAGVAGLIKAALCLKNRVIPPSLHCREPHPLLPWQDWRLSIPAERAMPWPDTGDRDPVAGVSSSGISGTNVHLVLTGLSEPARKDDAPALADEPAPDPKEKAVHLLPLSARDPQALRELADSHAEYLGTTGRNVPLRDICHSAGERRSHFEHRLAVTGSDHTELHARLAAAAAGNTEPGIVGPGEAAEHRVAFVFPGQGAQWTGMGRELLRDCPEFRRVIEEFDAAIAAEAGWSLLELLNDCDMDTAPIDRVQPALVAVEAGIARVLRDWGIEPDLVVGQSMGEIAAAYTADALSLEDTVRIICRRSTLMRRLSGRGASLWTALSEAEAAEQAERFPDRVSIAVISGPGSTVLSGDAEAIEEIRAGLEASDVFCRLIKVDIATHSPQMAELRDDMLTELEELAPRAARLPIWSTTDAGPIDGTNLDADYWMRNLREPVRFGPVLREIADAGPLICCEISPHPVLLPALQEILGPDDLTVNPLRRDLPERTGMLTALGELYVAGRPVSWSALVGDEASFTRLPTYPWQRERFWYTDRTGEPGPGQEQGHGQALLGLRQDQGADGADIWEGRLDLARHAFLLDHRVEDESILPGVAYVELVLEAVAELHGDESVAVTDVALDRALFLDPAREPLIRLRLQATERGQDGTVFRWFEVSSRNSEDTDSGDGGGWIVPARGRLRFGAADLPESWEPGASLAEVRKRCTAAVPAADFYRSLGRTGNQWSGGFQGITGLWQGDREVLTRIELTDDVSTAGFQVHPCLLDACLHGVIAAKSAAGGPGGSIVGGGLGAVVFGRRPHRRVWCHARLTGTDTTGYRGDVRLYDDEGTVVTDIRDVGVRYLEPGPEPHSAGVAAVAGPTGPADDSGVYTVRWEPADSAPAPEAAESAPGPYVVFADSRGVGEGLVGRLRSHGRDCVLVRPGDAFHRLGPGHYTIRPGSTDQHRQLLTEALADTLTDGNGTDQAHVVHLWSLDATTLADAERLGCADVPALMRALTTLPDPALTLVTSGAHAVHDGGCPHPEQAPLWGLGRAITSELPGLRLRLVDLDPAALTSGAPHQAAPDPAASTRHIDGLLSELSAPDTEDQVAFRGGRRLVPRLCPYRGNGVGTRPEHRGGPVELAVGTASPTGSTRRAAPSPLTRAGTSDTPNTLDSLRLQPMAARPPGHGEVAIKSAIAPLAFRSVLVALGILEAPDPDRPGLGFECAGTITALGTGVRGFSVGDEVLALSHQAIANHVLAPATLVCRRPANLGLEEAATVPGVFTTADVALRHVARVRPGEKVLIHSAAGGVGLAALQIARREGAEVLATAGTPEKRSLLRFLGATVVGDSRSTEYADTVREITNGYGVDVVLNMLSGEPRAASLDLLAPFGRWIELTKHDILQGVPMDMRPFERALSFTCVDVLQMAYDRPEQLGSSLREMTDLVARGELRPLPYQVFPVERAADAFRLMARSGHTGRVMLSFSRPEQASTSPPAQHPPVHADAGYLVTGGVGGIGLEVARRLVARGARNLLLVGRSPLTPERAEAVRELRATAHVGYEVVDVADEPGMKRVLTEWAAQGRPSIRGVVHAAGVIEYADVTDLTEDDVSTMMRPKAHGAAVLDRLFSGQDLDFFVLFSSGSALLPSPMIGAYAAANAYLDALAHRRRARGEVATSVDWGFWAKVGMVARYQREKDIDMTPDGMRSFDPDEGLAVLDRLISDGTTQAALLPTDWRRWAEAHPTAARVPFLSRVVPASVDHGTVGPTPPASTSRSVPTSNSLPTAEQDTATKEMENTTLTSQQEPRPAPTGHDEIVAYLRDVTGEILGLPSARVHPRRALNCQGLDSLMAVEIRARIKRDLGVDLPIVKFLSAGTLTDLATALIDRSTPGGR
ncbi:type I polyketide synthase [Nocardiopsis gilva]|uniref:type I polyketide synthase n=1 Tax=Nocardiopsis gilva TaxID=280236 RepID=UPI000A3122DB